MIKSLKIFYFFLKKVYQFDHLYMYKQAIYVLLQVSIMLIFVILPSLIIDTLVQYDSAEQAIFTIILYLSVILVLRMGMIQLTKHLAGENDVIVSMLFQDVSETIMDVKYQLMEDPTFLQQIHLALSPITNMNVVYVVFTSFTRLLQSVIVSISVGLIIASFQPILLGLIAFVIVLNFYFSKYTVNKDKQNIKSSLSQNKEYWYYLHNFRTPLLAKDIRIYGLQPFLTEKLSRIFDVYIMSGKKMYGLRNLRELVARLINVLLMVFMYAYLLYNAQRMGLSASELLLIVNASVSLYAAFSVIQSDYVILFQQVVYLEEYKKLFDLVALEEDSGSILFDEEIKTIEFNDVWFSYPNSSKDVLKGLSWSHQNHETVSIVGRNGSGKTTIIKLLCRLYKPSKGTILVNGLDIQTLDYSSYMAKLSVIFQDFKLLKYSLTENIAFDDIDEKRVDEAVKSADFDIELAKFSKGLGTLASKDIDSSGVNLSKGQEQKLAIARGIYKRGSLMILDEPTASLDPLAEEEVFKHFRKIVDKKLSIMISHRLSSCRSSNHIILIEDGIVKEKGTHDDLMALNGVYYDMFEKQSDKYI